MGIAAIGNPLLRQLAVVSIFIFQGVAMISVPNVTLAQQSAHMMYKDDACAKAMGMSIEKVEEGFAQLKMPITAQMLNSIKPVTGGNSLALQIPPSPMPATAKGTLLLPLCALSISFAPVLKVIYSLQ